MNIELKIAILRRYGSQIRAARPLRIEESRLSRLVQGHCDPSEKEREVLKRELGQDFFSTEEKESQADERRGLMEILADQRGEVIASAEPKKD